MFYTRFTASILLVVLASVAFAQGMPAGVSGQQYYSEGSAPKGAEYYARRYSGRRPDQTSIGPGFLLSNSLYKGEDDNLFIPIPLLNYRANRFSISGITAKYEIFSNRSTTLNALGQWRFDGYEASDSDFLAGMAERKRGFDGGVELRFADRSSGYVNIALVTDLSGNHKGNEARLSYGRTIRNDRTIYTPSIGIKYQCDDVTRYYYGVRPGEATAQRPFYNPSAAVNYYVGTNVIHPVGDRWTLFVLFNFEKLSGEISDSPIVDASYRALLITGLMYNF